MIFINIDKIKVIDSLLQDYYILYGYRKFNRIFYHIKYNSSPKKCKICGKETQFKNFNVGYKTYCSLICSRSDGSKTSPEMVKIAKEKALVLWCDENSFSYKHITEDDLKEYINAMKSRNYEHIFIDNFLKKYKW